MAALEMAVLLPILLIIFFGMIDLTALIADSRRVSYSANVTADWVTRLRSPVTPADINVAYDGAELVMNTATTGPVRVEIFTYYRNLAGDTLLRWSRNNGLGTDCINPSTAGLASLMTQGNDIVVVVVCASHTPIVANIITERFMGNTAITLRRQVSMRPRLSDELRCPTC